MNAIQAVFRLSGVCCVLSPSAMSDPLQSYGLQPTRPLWSLKGEHWLLLSTGFHPYFLKSILISTLRVCLAQLYLTLYDPTDCSPPGSSVHGTFQVRILEWVAISYTGDLPDPGIKPMSLVSPALAHGFFTTSMTWEAHPPPWLISIHFCQFESTLFFKLQAQILRTCPYCFSSRLSRFEPLLKAFPLSISLSMAVDRFA